MNVTLSTRERLDLIRNMGIMIGAGIPILKVIESLLHESQGNQKKVIQLLGDDLNQGKTISESFSKLPNAFDPITVNLIRASEESGNLDITLKDVANELKKDIEFMEKVKGALIYPLFVFILFIGIFLVILTYVIPRISQVFSRLDVVLPLPTKLMIMLSEFFLAHYIQVAAGLVIISIILFITYKAKRQFFIYTLFSLPLLSKLATEIDVTRITKSLGLLLKSGIPINEALVMSQQVASRRPMVDALILANKEVTEGKPLGVSLQKSHKVFPDMAIRFIEAGEQSGSLEQAMDQLSQQYADQVTNTLKSITTLLEPVMLVVIGIFIGGIMLSIIAPIYQLIGNISPR